MWPPFPHLPARAQNTVLWPAAVREAYKFLESTYNHATHVLLVDGADPTRISFHVDRITSRALPILMELTSDSDEAHIDGLHEDTLPEAWLDAVATLLGQVVLSELQSLGTTLSNWYVILSV